ncbi:MAG: zinc ribbon domain-containing protein [Gemmataceae bacterium]|nr:zinc ribbon domain-containing protein [Gemmataceae bacterium]
MQRCPRCQRANPPEASYCHNDGIRLDTVHVQDGDIFRHEWRFPSGRICRTLDEFVTGCLAEWTEARNALVRREFVKFFEENNRPDLARLVPPAEPDAEIALQNFLAKLPSKVKVAPALDVVPRRLLIPNVSKGEERKIILTVLNRGNGLLVGDLIVAEGSRWLRTNTDRIRARAEQPIEVTIDPRGFSNTGSYFARLQVRTNAGTIEVPIQVDANVRGTPFQGFHVTDAQDLARIMLSKPKLGAKWLADGSARKLFANEGWKFPLEGQPLAPSLGAVQQFFEALKLSLVPTVSLDAAGFEVTCEYPEMITRAVTLSTTSKKWVYAFVESGAFWLKPREAVVAGGRQVDVVFDIDSEMMEPGRIHEGVLHITINGNVEHTVWVRVDVRKPFEPWSRRIMKPFGK